MTTAHKPFIPDQQSIPEFTLIPILTGVVLGIIFGASSLYLALKVGMTVSASIPIAVMSITIFRSFSKAFGVRQATILENNIVQTTGSAGESIAFGVAVTMPALLILGYDMDATQVMLVAVLGSLIGVLMMIPLRRAFIVKEHGTLTYPEGTACAEVLIVGEKGGTSATTVFVGFGVGVLYKVLNVGLKLWKDVPERAITWYKGSLFSTEVSPELLGVGYIIGPRNSNTMVSGGILSTFVLIPAIVLFGGSLTEPLYPATKLISEMSTHDVWKSYILYIGAGAVASAGIISLIQTLPMITQSLVQGLKGLGKTGVASDSGRRTERDLPITVVVFGTLALIILIWIAPPLKVNLLGAALIVLFGFLFVTVSARLTGQVGSSSNPISGMTVATLLLTCLIFVIMGWIGPQYRVMALMIAGVVCVAASQGGSTSQDLKTGYLVGATPQKQQLALLIGGVTSALVIGYTLLLLNDASTIFHKVNHPTVQFETSQITGTKKAPNGETYNVAFLAEPKGDMAAGRYLIDASGHATYLVDPGINGVLKTRDDGTPVQKYEAPKARLMSLIIDGILTQKLPWTLVLIGVFLSIVLELAGVASLPFAVGVYLPLSSTVPIFFGGLIRWLVDRRNAKKGGKDSDESPGVLLSSGYIAGGAIAGIALALFALKDSWLKAMDFSSLVPSISQSEEAPYLFFAALVLLLYFVGRGDMLKAKTKKS